MWEQTLAAARAAAIPTDSILNATARVFLAQDTFTQMMASAYRQQLTTQILEQEEERSALVEALLSRRITDTPKPLGGRRPAAATHLGTLRRRGSRAAGDREARIAHNRKQARPSATSGRRGGCCRTYRSASSICGATRRQPPSASLSRCSGRPRPRESASVRRFTSWPKHATHCDWPGWRSPRSRRASRSLLSSTTPRLPSRRSARPRLWRRSGHQY